MPMHGKFHPRNPSKYKGNVNEIYFRSRIEFNFMNRLDKSSDIVSWMSEELHLPYVSPKDRKTHRYFPDFIYERKDGRVCMVEIKPAIQTKKPILNPNNKAKYVREMILWAINVAKWGAAEEFCKQKGWIWGVVTEEMLGMPKYG